MDEIQPGDCRTRIERMSFRSLATAVVFPKMTATVIISDESGSSIDSRLPGLGLGPRRSATRTTSVMNQIF